MFQDRLGTELNQNCYEWPSAKALEPKLDLGPIIINSKKTRVAITNYSRG